MAAARRLIVNADDFGLTPGVNRAIAEVHRNGVVTSATLMANGAAFDDAVRVAHENPTLGVGCHIVLLDGAPLLPAETIPTLAADKNNFERNLNRFAWRAVRGKINPREVRAEAEAQLRKLQSAGINVTHVDTHKHAHIFPAILQPLLEAANACGVRAIRNPFEPSHALTWATLAAHPQLWTRALEVRLLRRYATGFRKQASESGLATTNGSFGIVLTGALTQKLFAAAIRSVPVGFWEFVCHPGYDDAALAAVNTRLRNSRAQELQILSSPAAAAAIRERGIERASYKNQT